MVKKVKKPKAEDINKRSIDFEELIDVEEIESVLGGDKGEEIESSEKEKNTVSNSLRKRKK